MMDIQWLLSKGPCKMFKERENIPCPGKPKDLDRAMYILLSGRVDAYEANSGGAPKIAGSMLPGDVFGGHEYFAEVKKYLYFAAQDSAVFAINEKSFSEISQSKPDILLQILRAAYMPMREVSAVDEVIKAGKEAEKAAIAAKAASSASATEKTPLTEEQQAAIAAAQAPGGIYPEGHQHEKYIGKTEPDYAKLVFKKQYKCPACLKPFDDFKIFSSKLYEAQPMRYDLRKFYRDFKTEWYDVVICKNCFFSTLSSNFTNPKPLKKDIITDGLLELRQNVLIDFSAERDLSYVFTSHYIALLCADGYVNQKRQIKAKLWGSLSWLYEDEGDEEMMKFAANRAAEEYDEVFSHTHLSPAQEQMICLSIAGMQYRAGLDKNLKKYLFTAKTVQFGESRYARLADEFMYDLKLDAESS